MSIRYYDVDGNPCHPNDDCTPVFVMIDDYERLVWEMDQLRKAIQTTAEECAKIINEAKS